MSRFKAFNQTAETNVRMMIRHPYFMGCVYSMSVFELPEDWPPPFNTLATNGVSLWVNRKFWAQLDRDQKMTAIAHECGHKMYLHTIRQGDRDKAGWNIAGDHRINLDLLDAGFVPLKDLVINGKPWSWCCDPKYNTPKPWTTEEIYDDVMQQAQDGAGKGEGKGEGGKTITEILDDMIGEARDICDFGTDGKGEKDDEGAGKEGKKESPKEFEERVRGELKEMEIMAKMAGKQSAWMNKILTNVDHVKVNWYEVVEHLLTSMHKADYSWRRWSRRDFVRTGGVICPDMYEPALGGMVIYVDVSGSCWEVLPKFNMHFKDIVAAVRPKWVEVRYFQTHVAHEIDQRFERGEVDVQLQPKGNGGTSFTWLADETEALPEKPDCVMVLTDMYGAFGRPYEDAPVYWLSVSAIDKAPFGEVILIN